MKNIIFYQPIEMSDALESQSGTSIRPKEIKNAFFNSGYNVFDVNGSIKKRRQQVKAVIENNTIEYMYVESANIPMCISNKKHWKIGLFSDLITFYLLSKEMKTGMFYRDAHWRYPDYFESTGMIKGSILKILFYIEFIFIKKIFDYIFIPSDEFAKLLPNVKGKAKYIELPPGVDDGCKNRFSEELNHIKLLYSGNITNNGTYDIGKILKEMPKKEFKDVTFVINTPENSWRQYENKKFIIDKLNVIIRHYTYEEMVYGDFEEFFNVAVIYLSLPESIHKAAMPIKLFQYIGMGLPVIGCGKSAYGDFIKKNDIGWVLEDWNEIYPLLSFLKRNPKEIFSKHKNVLKVKKDNSWKARVNKVETLLEQNCK